MELTTFLKDGMVENWDMFENFIDYIYKKALGAIPRDHPLLITEPPVGSETSHKHVLINDDPIFC